MSDAVIERVPGDRNGYGHGDEEDLAIQVAKLTARIEARTNIEDVAKFILYFWAALTAALAFFGYRQMADIEKVMGDKVKATVDAYVAQQSGSARLVDGLLADTKRLDEAFREQNALFLERVDAVDKADLVRSDFDIEGQVQALNREALIRENHNPEPSLDGLDFEGTLLEPQWRARAINTLKVFNASIASHKVDPAQVFDAAQLARRIDAHEVAVELASQAERLQPYPEYKALGHVTRITQSANPGDVEKEFAALLRMVHELTDVDSPEIILSEAWNAADRLRRHRALIDAISALEARARTGAPTASTTDPAPIFSYAYVIKAQALLRESRAGCVEEASKAIAAAEERLQAESTLSPWYASTIREGAEVKRAIKDSGSLKIASAPEAADQAALLEALRSMIEPDDDLASTEQASVLEASTPDGIRFEVGQRVTFKTPEDPSEGPGWIDEMGTLAGEPMTVAMILQLEEYLAIKVRENPFTWDSRWLVKVEPASE